MKKIGDRYKVSGKIYYLIDYRMQFPHGIFGNKVDDEPFALQSEEQFIVNLNGSFKNINDLVNTMNRLEKLEPDRYEGWLD
jgi:hypothetical protein